MHTMYVLRTEVCIKSFNNTPRVMKLSYMYILQMSDYEDPFKTKETVGIILTLVQVVLQAAQLAAS